MIYAYACNPLTIQMQNTLYVYKCWCHLSSSGCCLPSWKKKLWIFHDRFAVCLSTCHDSETFNFLCYLRATYINLAVHLSKVSILCLYFMYIYRCICYGSLNVASCSRCSVYNINSLNRLLFFGLSEKFN